ncbi:outer dense fiber protein 3-like [Diabrotica virgifera virgifera]|uniref:Outer dense fiber protein 3-like n=1 Tax=Diabrotica virgifera virgifera TaxID=50390 RepID=A0ABM5JLP8_DIAVI|nr:outer dense fiber protein 3-like [Diabrotica virgifera virgifera]
MPVRTDYPAPNKYNLPSVIGYPKHDISKYRYPNYTMAPKFPPIGKPLGPGPKYYAEHYTRVGKVTAPIYSIKSRAKPLTQFVGPGAGAYHPELSPRMKDQRPPCYTIKSRRPPLKGFQTPGPKYALPTTLGCHIPDVYERPCYTMRPKLPYIQGGKTPGPKYLGIDTNIFKQRPPLYTMRPKLHIPQRSKSPGPKYYPQLPRCVQVNKRGWSFGLKIWKTDPYYMPKDLEPAC